MTPSLSIKGALLSPVLFLDNGDPCPLGPRRSAPLEAAWVFSHMSRGTKRVSSKPKVVRFAFGTEAEPGSSVWRATVTKGGDIYVNSAPAHGKEVHIALHASGRFHYRLGRDTRFDLEPPWRDPSGRLCGPCLFFFRWDRPLPPPPPSGKKQLITWLGWPEDDHLLIVRTFYTEPSAGIRIAVGDTQVAGPVPARLLHRPMDFYLIAGQRQMAPEERATIHRSPEVLDFKGVPPDHLEYFRVSKTPQGPSAIIHDTFALSPADMSTKGA